MPSLLDNWSKGHKFIAGLVCFLAVLSGTFMAGWNGHGVYGDTVDVPAQLKEIKLEIEEGFSQVSSQLSDLSDSVRVNSRVSHLTALAICDDASQETMGAYRGQNCVRIDEARRGQK